MSICLFLLDHHYVGKTAIAAGWGTLKEDGKPSCELQEVEVPVISNDECRMTNYSSKMISDNMMCAGYPKTGKKDSCQVCFYISFVGLIVCNFIISQFLIKYFTG